MSRESKDGWSVGIATILIKAGDDNEATDFFIAHKESNKEGTIQT